ncbi:MAG: hypothetical protein KKA05_08880 [Alphaproteobacteria bacterium]|nr:hypothetical protein [Alphaproteobacteria bacterium]
MQKVTRGWPPARRAAQAARIRETRIWTRATGPRTAAGKARSSQNARKYTISRHTLRGIRMLLRWQRQCLRHIMADLPPPPPPTLTQLRFHNTKTQGQTGVNPLFPRHFAQDPPNPDERLRHAS